MADKIVKDPLHIVSLVLTVVATACQVMGSFLPNWWMLKGSGNVVTSYTLFGNIRCHNGWCFPYGNATDTLPEEEGDSTAMWLSIIRVLSIIGIALVALSLLIQVFFLLVKPVRPVAIAIIATLFLTGLVSFVNGFMFISKYTSLSHAFKEHSFHGLIYNSGASALILISMILCIVSAVATIYGMRRPSAKQYV